MKKRILLILFVFPLFISFIQISCQKEEVKWKGITDEVRELIEKNINARGGYEKLKAVKSLKITAKYIQGSRETPVILTIKRPNFIYGEVLFPSSPMICGYDGKTAWWFNRAQLSEPQTLTAEEALIFTRYADFGDLFVDYEQKGQKIELIGLEDMDGQKAHKLKITSQNDIIRYVYLDAKNFLNVKESYKSKNKKEFGLEVSFKDFRAIDGVMFPFYHDITGEQTIIERIEMNVDIDDSIFKMPQKTGQTDQLSVSEFVRELDAYLKTNTEKDLFSGVVLVAHKGKPIFKKAYGMADRERNISNQVDTKFCIGSMQKMFTAVAIAQLVEQGKLSYDDLIGKYLGADWILSDVGEKVKISHLLSHTSGIAELLDDEFYKFHVAGTYRTLEDRKPIVKEKSLTFEPGTRWAYCNTGFILLGAIIEKVTGRDYSDYIKEHIFDPADMDNTIDTFRNKTLSNLAMGYDKVQEEGKAFWRNTGFFGKIGSPPSGGFSTVDDLLKFAEALRSDLLISSESKELLMSVKARSSSIDLEYGYGFIIESSRKFGRVVGHGGAAPGVSSNFRMFVDKGYAMIILSNYSEASLPVSSKIRSLLPLK
ncbi:MAG: serine hydrolase [Candidatus Aminicenantes bacterium]|nr:serine hydrolase [Candidatus Aminicenantes bacterium]